MSNPIDLLVIGAGLHGLAVAKTYSESLPQAKILIVDSADSIGGVWAQERLYPGLKTNNVVGSYEFSDFPMGLKRYGLEPGQHIPGPVVHRYLCDFAHHFDLFRRTRLRTKVEAATLGEDGTWCVEFASGCGSESLMARNIAVATGLTSQPLSPSYPGLQDRFNGKFFHAVDLSSQANHLRDANGHVVVIGANKSAWDVCYTAATASPEATVHMLIRAGGRGPSWMWRRRGLLGNALSISRITSTRVFTWFDPNPLASATQRYFTASWLGRVLCAMFWAFLDCLVLWTSGYISISTRLAPLRPRFSTFWMGNSLSVHNYETDWFDLVRDGRIIVHHAEIEAFKDGNTVHLSDGQVIDHVTVVVACTGWKHTPNVCFSGIEKGGGVLEEEDKSETLQHLNNICPSIQLLCKKQPPRTRASSTSSPPLQLYRFMTPLNPQLNHFNNLVFVGFYQSVHTTLVAQAQAVWSSAFLQRALSPVDAQTCRQWTHCNMAYQQMRRLGSPFPDLVLDALPYIDLLLEDVGLRRLRKKGRWRNLVEQHRPADYRGLVEEWRQVQQSRGS
ncbi:FAD/NAD(P)-binding domain-containing protein [Rhypophila decipiens]|uniref:FAD/NAD(P)-binding domain-containing protein n=1 Tax=Rhypophila decipiens TaxID=261697 RepID=A0AAN7BAY5_9PEZI|nr:FAD/NAD(P)-binding domain-containing protein [Rhypophila decipiens]